MPRHVGQNDSYNPYYVKRVGRSIPTWLALALDRRTAYPAARTTILQQDQRQELFGNRFQMDVDLYKTGVYTFGGAGFQIIELSSTSNASNNCWIIIKDSRGGERRQFSAHFGPDKSYLVLDKVGLQIGHF